MKTSVRSILVRDEYGGRKYVQIQMPNGDLKKRLLVNLLRAEVVVPGEGVCKVLLESLERDRKLCRENKRLRRSEEEAYEALASAEHDYADVLHSFSAIYGKLLELLEKVDDLIEEGCEKHPLAAGSLYATDEEQCDDEEWDEEDEDEEDDDD